MIGGAVVAAIVMIVLGFFFAAVSGNLVGMIGSSNNPVSGLTLCTLVIAALLMVALGLHGNAGIAAVLGVAAVVCVSSAVAGEMLQDLKAGHILGGTPAKMQIGDLLGIAVSSLALFFPLMWLHRAYTFGTPQLSAPQAGLMASLAQGIVGGNMAWPLVVVGILMGFGLILVEVRSPMLFSVGMYLPLETTFAIFVGGLFRWFTDKLRDKGNYNDAQKARIENAGVLTAAGLIAGEALCGLVVAGFRAAEKAKGHAILPDATWAGTNWLSLAVLIGAGGADDPAAAGTPGAPTSRRRRRRSCNICGRRRIPLPKRGRCFWTSSGGYTPGEKSGGPWIGRRCPAIRGGRPSAAAPIGRRPRDSLAVRPQDARSGAVSQSLRRGATR